MYEGSACLEPRFGLHLPPLVLTFSRFDCDMAMAAIVAEYRRLIGRGYGTVVVAHDCVCKIQIQQRSNVSIGPKKHHLHLQSSSLLGFSALSANMERKLPQLS